MGDAQRQQRCLLETRLAWGDTKPEVKPPNKPERIKYLSDEKGK
jgi:hypothetical protein